MSLFVAGSAIAAQAGASAGTAAAAGAAAELGIGLANWNELTEPEAHVSVNSLHDVAGIASANTSSVRPAKKPRSNYTDPNQIVIRNVKVTRESMDGMESFSASDQQNKRHKVDNNSNDGDDDVLGGELGQPDHNTEQIDLLLADTPRPPPDPDPEPHDAMLHAMRCGAGTSAVLNKEGASANYFTVESQAEPVQSVDANGNAIGYGLWRWDLSLSQFRFKTPCKKFLSMYKNYRIRKVQVHFYAIKLDTSYVAERKKQEERKKEK